MAKNIEPKLRKIGDYLKLDEDAVFTIPEYQRAYSWRTENCDKLWQDILDFVASDSKDRYFFGTIIVNCQDNDEKLGLIDGQQRTTTFLLLLKALLVQINVAIGKTENDDDSVILCRGLKERRRRIMGILYKAETEDVSDNPDLLRDSEICKRACLLENYSINERYKTELATILQAYDYVDAESKVTRIPYKQKDNKYTNFFRNYKFFYEKISELSVSELNSFAKAVTENCEVIEIRSWQVEQAITMFNSLNSDGLPLYDSDIISAKMYAVAEAKDQGKEFTASWKELLDIIAELSPKGIANIDSILMQYMYCIRALKKEVLTETGTVNVTTPGLRRYYTELNKDMINNPLESSKSMINLAKIWKKVSSFSIAQVIYKFNENTKLFLACFFSRFNESEITEEKVEAICECILRLFVILELVDTGYSSSSFKTFLFGESVKLVDKSWPIEDIKSDFDNHIRTRWTPEGIEELLNEYEGNILVILNEYLFAKDESIDFILGDKYDIEHIMPASGFDLQIIRKDAGIESEDEFKECVNKLGNKIILEEKINRSIGNEWFRSKVSSKLENKEGYVNSKYPIASCLVKKYQNQDKPFWIKNDIELATNAACVRIVRFVFDNNEYKSYY